MRVAIARALVTKPKVMLMDEPFAALDEITRFRLNDDLLKIYKKYNLTIIFITHSVYESAYLSNKIARICGLWGNTACRGLICLVSHSSLVFIYI